MMRIRFDLPAQSRNRDVDGTGERNVIVPPHETQEFVPRDDFALSSGQMPEDFDLARPQVDFGPAFIGA